jgi:hypothetical protein
MERQWALNIILIISTILLFPQNAKSKPGNVNLDAKVHVNGKKVIDESHPNRPDGKRINQILVSLRIGLVCIII